VADDCWREAVALKRYWSHPMMLIGAEPQSYPSYRDMACRSPHVSVIQIVRVCPIDPLRAPASPEQWHHPNWCSDIPYSENSRLELG
jgi:hypothetical protein